MYFLSYLMILEIYLNFYLMRHFEVHIFYLRICINIANQTEPIEQPVDQLESR